MLLEISGEITPERMETEPKQKQHPVVDVTGDGNKVQCCKEQYFIGTWNDRSMNQGKFKVVKQEMARVNISILGISELNWTGMGEFNSDDLYIYYHGQESLRRNATAIIVNKVRNAVLGCNLKNDRVISVHRVEFGHLKLPSSELNSAILVHFSSLIPRMSMFTLAISCLTTSNLP